MKKLLIIMFIMIIFSSYNVYSASNFCIITTTGTICLGGNGTITAPAGSSYVNGTGLSLVGGVFSLLTSYRLPQTCGDGQLVLWNSTSGAWDTCSDPSGGGTVTSVTRGFGFNNTGVSITTTGTLNINKSVIQVRVSDDCAGGSSIRTIYENGSVDCETDTDTDTNTWNTTGQMVTAANTTGWLINWSNHITTTGDNASWNESYANTLYAAIGAGSDNTSWNETYADSKYVNTAGDTMTGTLNIRKDAVGADASLSLTPVTDNGRTVIDFNGSTSSSLMASFQCSGNASDPEEHCKLYTGDGNGGVQGRMDFPYGFNVTPIVVMANSWLDFGDITNRGNHRGSLIEFGDSNDTRTYYNGTSNYYTTATKNAGGQYTSTFTLQSNDNTPDSYFNLNGGTVYVNGNIRLNGDNDILYVGANQEMQMYTSGTNVIWYFGNQHNLQIFTQNTSGSNIQRVIGRSGDNPDLDIMAWNLDLQGTQNIKRVNKFETNVNATGYIVEATSFIGNGSQLTDLPVTDTNTWNTTSEMITAANTTGWLINWSNHITTTGDNASWNESYANTLYALIGAGSDNSSWNETYANTLYAPISVTGDNASWNETYADTKYLQTETDPNWAGNLTAYNTSWSYYETNTWNSSGDIRNAIDNSGYYNISINYSNVKNHPADIDTWNTTSQMITATNTTGWLINWSANILAKGLYRLESWNNFTGIPHATPSNGDTTHFSLADEIYDWVVGLGYITGTNVAYKNETNTFTTNQNLSNHNITDVQCITFESGGKICTG